MICILNPDFRMPEHCGGDRWSILHGDSLQIIRQFEPNSFDAIITDPPYASGGSSQTTKNRSTSEKYSSMSKEKALPDFDSDQMDQLSWMFWTAAWLQDARRIAKPGAPVCLFIDWRQLPAMTLALQWAGWTWRGVAVWDKVASRPQKGRFRQQSEYIVWGSNGKMPLERNVGCLPGVFRWQSYRNKANFPKMVAAACIINDGSSDDRFTDFRNWLIMQGYDAYRQALIDPDNLAALNIPFRNTEWMGCGNVAWYAYAGQQLRTYFEKAGITAELHRKYPAMLELPDDLNRAIMREQLAPHRAQETEWERQMLRTEVKHYIDTSGLAYSYNEFYTQNMPDKVAWKTLQSDLFSNLPQIKAERMPQDFSVVLPKLWRKRQAWDTERTKRPPYRGEER